MDKRRNIKQKKQLLSATLDSDEVNLDLARKICQLADQRELIKFKAAESFKKNSENNQVFTMLTPSSSIESGSKSLYLFTAVFCFGAIRLGCAFLSRYV